MHVCPFHFDMCMLLSICMRTKVYVQICFHACMYIYIYIFIFSIFIDIRFLCISSYKLASLWNCSYIDIYVLIYVHISIVAYSWACIVKRRFLICIVVYI